ncbi:MAG: single-stranded-DNA-specific exonuclease RecJ [Bryobacteraceae bacterium]
MQLPSRWILPDPNTPPLSLASRVLWNRGLRGESEVARFLNPRLEDLHDPMLLKDMDRAVSRLHRAIEGREKILLYGDYDVDGTSSVVILKKILDLTGANVEFHVPHRVKDGYGMRTEVIDRAAASGVSLVISVDTGIRANAVVAHAATLGIDVIVTDHHLPETELPRAVAVINPNRPDCTYPEKNLCGAGVTFKLIQALLRKLEWPAGRANRMMESLLKLVALATVADVVPLTGENRVIVRRGLEGFHTVRNPGLRALLRVAGIEDGDCPSAGQVAFRIAPRINAAGRMANADDVINLFLTADEALAMTLADQLNELNRERQETEAAITAAILEECVQVPVTNENFALVFAGRGWHRGVVGIVASRLVERFHRPAFVLSEDEGTGVAHGSGRSAAGFHLLEGLEAMGDLFTKFGGHKQAAGLTMQADQIESFRARFNAFAAERLSVSDFRRTVEIDALLRLNEVSDETVAEVLSLAPFGAGNSAPVFAVMGAEVCAPPVVMKEKHLRLAVRQGGRTLTVKAWSFAERAAELQPGARVDLALCLEEDSYSLSRGYPGWAATLKDVRPAGGSQ